MASIKPLSETVLSTVRSGFIISSLATVVEELIYNSLDASARKVSILVGVNNGYVKVEDDGSGIDRDGLLLLGERYATSKSHNLNKEDDSVGTFGFRGEVLCSIADISLIEIVTKIRGMPNGYRKVMKGRRCLYLSIDDKQDVGTTVIVRDLFYNQPVRRRQLQSSTKKVLHSVRECVMRIALVQPKVTFRVVDMESEDELLCTHASPAPLSLLSINFGLESSTLCKLSSSEGSMKLTGYVSAPSSLLSSKVIQYIYINSRFVVKGPVHKALTCLADMCLDCSRGERDGKRTQLLAGPSYCLNLACSRALYDLNLEVSGTSVEFKDWAPVIRFIEKSVSLFWSTKKRKGESSNCEADLIQSHGTENLVEDMSTSKKDWRLKTCDITAKRRRSQNTENDKASSEDSLYCLEMQVDDKSSSSIRQSSCGQPETIQPKTLQFKEERKYSPYGSSASDNVRKSLLFDQDHAESDMGLMKKDDNCSATYLCQSGWKGGLGAGSNEIRSGFNFGYKQDNDINEDNHRHRKLLLESPPWENTLTTPLNCGQLSSFQIDNFESMSWRPTGRGDVDGLCQDHDVSLMPCRQRDVPNTWLLPKIDTESYVWEDLNIHFRGSSDRQSKSLGENFSENHPSSCFTQNSVQHSEIRYPFVNMTDWDPDHLMDGDVQRTTGIGNCYGFNLFDDKKQEFCHNALDHLVDDDVGRTTGMKNCYGFNLSDEEKEEFCQNALGDRCMDESLSSVSSLATKLVLESGYAGVGNGISELSVDGCRYDAITSIIPGDLLSRETISPSSDSRLRDLSFYWSPIVSVNRGVQMGLQRCQSLVHHDSPRVRSLRMNHRSCPDSPLFPSSDDILIEETVPSGLDFFNMHKPSGPCVSSTSVDKNFRKDLLGCHSVEANHSRSEQFKKSSLRTRRSHSAPPIYPGKRRFLSVGDCLTPSTENPVRQTDPQALSVSDRAMPAPTCEKSSAGDPLFCTDRQLTGDPTISQGDKWSEDVKSGDTGYIKEVEDLESSRVKWREGCHDTALKRITNCRSVRDTLDESKDRNRVLDLQSCMLYLTGDSLVPKSINRNCLESAEVLLQVDSKFIPVVGRGILAVIDQHAADERIRLEEMRQKILSGELRSITHLEEEKELVLPEIGYQLLCNYAESIQHWGWICNIFCQDSGSFSRNLNLLNDHASHLRLLAVPCILGVKLSDADLLEYLEQLSDTDGSSTIPPSVVRILNNKACRGAIMFGDKLLSSECSLIVEELKRTSLCFQCAHGRPTTVPLVNLKALHKAIHQLGSSSREGSKTTWHGLCRNDINLERARHRLDAARSC